MSSDQKTVLITGVSGQDGSNMVDYLLKNTNHKIVGTVRMLSNANHDNIKEYMDDPRFTIELLDLVDPISIRNTFEKVMPDYFINFAAQSFVGESWHQPVVTFQTNTIAIINILEIIRTKKPSCRFYSAGSSEEFGDVETVPQTLTHPLKPRSPYGASKCAARHIVKVYRESYDLFAIHCVLFNHEGIRRGKQFVTRKITHNLARIQHELERGETPKGFQLGNIFARRDWSDSEDFVTAVWLMLNKDEPKEYILSSNEDHSVKDFIDEACKVLGMATQWEIDENEPLNTKLYLIGINSKDVLVTISEDLYRLAEVDILKGDCRSTLKELDWQPKSTFSKLVEKMIKYDYELLS